MTHAVLFVLILLLGQQTAPRPASIQIIAVGQVSKIDTAKKSLELRTQTEAPRQGTDRDDDVFFDIRIGRVPDASVPGGRQRPEIGSIPRNPSIADEPERSPFPRYTTTRVFLTSETVCKEGKSVVLCADLKHGDRLRVTGEERTNDPRGKGLYAKEVTRN